MVRLVSDAPLRVKLISALLVLVTLALVIIGVASALVVRHSLVTRVDSQLRGIAKGVNQALLANQRGRLLLPGSNFIISVGTLDSIEEPPSYAGDMTIDRLPVMPTGDAIKQHLNSPYSANARGGANLGRWRVLVMSVSTGQVLLVGESLGDIDGTIGTLVAAELIIGAGVVVVLASLGVAIVQTSLQPLREIERTAQAIAAGDLTRRVPAQPPETEGGRLALALNAMLAQIEWAFRIRAASEERMRQFVADASHELRTPLTTIRGFAELYRQGAAREPEQTEALLKRIEDEAARMGLLVEDLLLLARLDQERPFDFAPLDLRVIALDAAEAARVVAPDREITLDVERDDAVVVDGDESRLRQVVGNLVTNALTHTPAGSPVTIRLRVDGDDALIEVADSGSGLTEEQAAHVFERFFRVDKARTRQAAGTAAAMTRHSGSGLGLAIVAALVAAHRGTVSVHNAVEGGAVFQVRLPLTVGSQLAASEPQVELGTV
jgi:two-component system OmpR family sensor kinase